jgi:uncharacterized protein YgfB (UPF0149 family)
MYDYQFLRDTLSAAGSSVSASECHGFVCGQLCGTDAPDEELLREFVDPRCADDKVAEACYGDVRSLVEETREQMWSGDFALALLLPDDDTGMEERVEALAGWCRGFLSGFGLLEGLPSDAFSVDLREWLGDMALIARAGVERPDEDDEMAFVQVADHVRTGVLLAVEELRGLRVRHEQEDSP